MAVKDLYLCYVMYFPAMRHKSWVEPFCAVAAKYAGEFGREVTHFVPDPYDNMRWRSKTYRYIKRNYKHLTQPKVDSILKTLEFYSVGSDNDLLMSPLLISLNNTQKDKNYGTVFMQCQTSVFEDTSEVVDFSRRFIGDVNLIVKIEYGLVCLMRGNKYPGLYFGDLAASTHLTDEEEKNAKVWEKQGSQFQTLVRDVYWGNVLSKAHWGNNSIRKRSLLQRLKRVCEENVFSIDEKSLFFCAPFDILDSIRSQRKLTEFKDQVHKLYENSGIKVLKSPV